MLFTTWLLFHVTSAGMSLVPGPNCLLVLTHGAMHGTRKALVPERVAVGIRISATDWVDGGWNLEQSIALSQALDARGSAYIRRPRSRATIAATACARLPVAVRCGDQGRGEHAGHRRRPDHRAAAGRGSPAARPGRPDRPRPRHALRPVLALACGSRTGRQS